MLNEKQKEELEFLYWFYCNCDFGPAHYEVMREILMQYKEETGKDLPAGYEMED